MRASGRDQVHHNVQDAFQPRNANLYLSQAIGVHNAVQAVLHCAMYSGVLVCTFATGNAVHNKLLWTIADARRTNMSKYVPKCSDLVACAADDGGDGDDDFCDGDDGGWLLAPISHDGDSHCLEYEEHNID